MFLAILTLITALSISAVAIYYSVAGLVAIFAAAAIPIMIMGGVLEVSKLITAVWLHKYWRQTTWWLKAYLSAAVIVLMFITSMGIFGFLSKAHIEQTASAQEGIAQLSRIDEEIARQQALISRLEEKIVKAESSVGESNDAIQAQIDKEQERIDNAYIRIQSAIDEQTATIEAARKADEKRTEPYEQQLANLEQELLRLDEQAKEYESRIATLSVDIIAIEPILEQIATIEESISLVQGQIAGGERDAIRAAQRTIGVRDDGSAGPNTRRAADAWIVQQQTRISELQSQVSKIRLNAQETVDTERTRLTNLVTSIRGEQTDNIKRRTVEILKTIDEVRSNESPVIITAREEIIRLRSGAEEQIEYSNELIKKLRDSLQVGTSQDVEKTIADETKKILDANNTIDTLTQQKYTLEAEYRKLEAEVGPVKYIAEFVYGEQANQNLLEEAVRWVILLIIFVFDPLAVLLLIASQHTFELLRSQKKKKKEVNFDNEYENLRAKKIIENPGWEQETSKDEDVNGSDNEQPDQNTATGMSEGNTESIESDNFADSDPRATEDDVAMLGAGYKNGSMESERSRELDEVEKHESFKSAKQLWKEEHPDETIKDYKDAYIKGKIDELPWEKYVQNSEQSNNSIWQRIRNRNE